MKLLICTQIVDRKDPTLGFFVRWIEELAAHAEEITVICLQKGEYELPPNVRVYSLGKESARGPRLFNRLRYSVRFLAYAMRYRVQYDAVLVHMNQEYVLLGGWLWKLGGKKIYLWRNHYEGSLATSIAGFFCDKVFYTSRFSYTASFPRSVRMPVGVDVESVRMDVDVERKPRSVLFLARLEESKRPDLLIEALGMLHKRGVDFTATIVGGPSDPASPYPERLRSLARELGIGDKVVFTGAVANTETFRQYRSHEIFVNCSRSGMFDKTMFKATASGCLVLAASRDFGELAGEEFLFKDNDAEDLARKLERFLSLTQEERGRNLGRLAEVIEANTLPALIERLAHEMSLATTEQKSLDSSYVREYYDARVGALASYTDDRWHSSVVREFEYAQTKRALCRALSGRTYGRVLEIGPGDGVWTPVIAEYATGDIHLVEQSNEMLARAKQKLASRGGVTFEHSDFLTSSPPRGNDLIIALRCFEYFQNKEGALDKMRELLAPGGRIIIITKNAELLTSTPVQDRRIHSDQVSRREMRRLATHAGLRITDTYPAVLRWKASIALMRLLFNGIHAVAVLSRGYIVIPFVNTYAAESYVFVMRRS